MSSDPGGGGGDSIRVGDAERNAAMDALSQHLSAGRLDLDEFGTRSAQVNAARTVAELQAPFADLPAPGPGRTLPAAVGPAPAAVATPTPGGTDPLPAVPATRGQKIALAVSGSAGILAVIAFFLLNPVWDSAWLVFLLIPVVYTVTSAVTGVDVREAKRRHRD